MQSRHQAITLGVIEGFYGRTWSPPMRLQMMDWLAALRFDAYLYAPKADACLRKRWRSAWDVSTQTHIEEVSVRCRSAGIQFFIGLSPFALYLDYDTQARVALQTKLETLIESGAGGVALLFDDMPGEHDALAARQIEICIDSRDVIGDLPLVMCPTYYSDDPILDKVFGQRPGNYLDSLGRELPPEIGVFWTGPQVCSERLDSAALETPVELLGDRLALWDNYPVNDSKQRSEHLYLQPLPYRNKNLAHCLSGHWCNAMNQAALSLPALASLPALYDRSTEGRGSVLNAAGLSPELIRACDQLASIQRSELDSAAIEELRAIAAEGTPAAQELGEWLKGYYAFDPDCLTD